MIPRQVKILQPKSTEYEKYKLAKQNNINKMKSSYNKSATNLPPLRKGDDVYFQLLPNGKWSPGKIKDKVLGDVNTSSNIAGNYTVETVFTSPY